MSPRGPSPTDDVAERISAEIGEIHRHSYGEELTGIRTYLLQDEVLCVLDITLLTHERTLLANDRGRDSIREVRKQFEESIGTSFKAAIEHMTGRRVLGFVSETNIDPPFSIEFFRLAPAAEGILPEQPERDLA